MNRDKMTELERDTFDFIKSWVYENQAVPSYRKIARYFRLSVGVIQKRIKNLIEKGYLEKIEDIENERWNITDEGRKRLKTANL